MLMEIFDPQQDPAQRPAAPVSVGDWFVTILLMVIPLVNLVLLCVWAFGGNTHPSKANWAKASLIWMVVGIALWLLFASSIMAMMAAMGGLR